MSTASFTRSNFFNITPYLFKNGIKSNSHDSHASFNIRGYSPLSGEENSFLPASQMHSS